VLDEILARLPVTLQLTGLALATAIVVSFPIGILSASLRGGTADTVVRMLAILGLTLPSFWVGVLMLYFASVYLPQCGRRSATCRSPTTRRATSPAWCCR
jgi:ABC-type dipeptide/oligopeptide/nickel transport system permease component